MASSRYNYILSICKARETLLELLGNRGFKVEKYSGYSKNEIDTMAQHNTLDMLVTDNDEAPTKKMYIKFSLEKTVNAAEMENIMQDLYENADDTYKLGNNPEDGIVVVVADEPNKKSLTFLSEVFKLRGRFITLINIKRLQFNVLKHELQPKEIHILTVEERDDVMRSFNVASLDQLPEISRFDPLAMALFLRPGQVCKMVRNSPTALSVPYYRACA